MREQIGTPAALRHKLEAETESIEDRRALLAFWASDIHAVRDHPALRQVEDGSIFHVDDLLEALKRLDTAPPPARRRPPTIEVLYAR